MITDVIISALLIFGAALALIGSLGLAKLPDFFMRLHGPSKATTLGLGSILIAAAVYGLSSDTLGIAARPILITFFLFITTPVSAHLLARAAIRHRLYSQAELPPQREPKHEPPQR